MKKLYALALCLVWCALALQGAEIQFTLVVPDARSVVVTREDVDGSLLHTYSISDGANVLTAEENSQVVIRPTAGYVLINVQEASEGFPRNPYGGAVSLYIASYCRGAVYTVNCKEAADLRTSEFTLVTDNAANLSIYFTATGYEPALADGTNVVKFSAQYESQMSFRTKDGSPIYKVIQNGQTIGAGIAYLSVSPNDRIEILVDFPDVDVPVSFSFTKAGTEDFLTSVVAGGVTYAADQILSSGLTVRSGTEVIINADTEHFIAEEVVINGTFQSHVFFPMSVIISDATEIVFDVTRKEPFTKRIMVSGAGMFKFFSITDQANPFTLVDGLNELTLDADDTHMGLSVDPGCVLTRLTDGDNDLLPAFEEYGTSFYIDTESVLYISAEKINMEKTMVVYADDPASASYYFSFINSRRESYDIAPGYNVIHFNEDYVPFEAGWAGENVCYNAYLNDNKVPGLFGDLPPYEFPVVEDGDVIKLYLASNPEFIDLTVTVDDGVDVSLTRDIIVPLSAGTVRVLPGTVVGVSSRSGCVVRVGDSDGVEVGAGLREFTIDGAATLTVTGGSGVADIAADARPAGIIYSLQGIAVGTDTSSLPAGIYIREGRKFIVR